jgi:GNAT superfamily N-acetyltransferase
VSDQLDTVCAVSMALPDIEVRPATAQDSPVVAEIWHLGWQDGHLGFVPDELAEARDADSFRTRAAQRVRDTTVAVVDGDVVGFTMIVGNEVEQMYVAGSHRGSGVAGVLMADAERRIRDAGNSNAWLAVVEGNARARRFYERCGWHDSGPFDYAAAGEGGPILVPCLRYVKELRGD